MAFSLGSKDVALGIAEATGTTLKVG